MWIRSNRTRKIMLFLWVLSLAFVVFFMVWWMAWRNVTDHYLRDIRGANSQTIQSFEGSMLRLHTNGTFDLQIVYSDEEITLFSAIGVFERRGWEIDMTFLDTGGLDDPGYLVGETQTFELDNWHRVMFEFGGQVFYFGR